MNLAAQYFNSSYRMLKTIHESPRPECRLLLLHEGKDSLIVGAGICSEVQLAAARLRKL
jgi:hypothetical protein